MSVKKGKANAYHYLLTFINRNKIPRKFIGYWTPSKFPFVVLKNMNLIFALQKSKHILCIQNIQNQI